MSIPQDVAYQLLDLSQRVLSNIEFGNLVEAKRTLLCMASVISAEMAVGRAENFTKLLTEEVPAKPA